MGNEVWDMGYEIWGMGNRGMRNGITHHLEGVGGRWRVQTYGQ